MRAPAAAVLLAVAGAGALLLAGFHHSHRSAELLAVLPEGQMVKSAPMLWGRFVPGVLPGTASPERAEAEFVYYQHKYGPHVEAPEEGPAFYENYPEDASKLPGVNVDSKDWPIGKNFPFGEMGHEIDEFGTDGRPDPVFEHLEVPRQGYPTAEEMAAAAEQEASEADENQEEEHVEGEEEPLALEGHDERAAEHSAGQADLGDEEVPTDQENDEEDESEEERAAEENAAALVKEADEELNGPAEEEPKEEQEGDTDKTEGENAEGHTVDGDLVTSEGFSRFQLPWWPTF